MTRIAKRSRSVKRQKRAKQPPRYTIRKDSLDRRYAVDKRTGQRVLVQKAEKERKQRRKVVVAIPRHIPTISRKPSKKRSQAAIRGWETRRGKKRSQAAIRGWETRRAETRTRSKAAVRGWETRRKHISEILFVPIAPPIVITPPVIPEGIVVIPLYDRVRDKIDVFPRVKEAAEFAFAQLQAEAWENRVRKYEGRRPPPMTEKERTIANIRMIVAERIQDPSDIDRVLEDLYEEFNREYNMRELYTLYFSPEVA